MTSQFTSAEILVVQLIARRDGSQPQPDRLLFARRYLLSRILASTSRIVADTAGWDPPAVGCRGW